MKSRIKRSPVFWRAIKTRRRGSHAGMTSRAGRDATSTRNTYTRGVSTGFRTNFESSRNGQTNRMPPYIYSQRHTLTVACQ